MRDIQGFAIAGAMVYALDRDDRAPLAVCATTDAAGSTRAASTSDNVPA